jgi:hypothetical protein
MQKTTSGMQARRLIDKPLCSFISRYNDLAASGLQDE